MSKPRPSAASCARRAISAAASEIATGRRAGMGCNRSTADSNRPMPTARKERQTLVSTVPS